MEAKLTFYPITKNVIFLSKQLLFAVINKLDLYFGNQHIRNGEKEFFGKRGIDVYPWLWSKIPSRNADTLTGWELYFDMWNVQNVVLTNNLFINTCISSNEIFKPNERIRVFIENEINKIERKHDKMITVHLRRGDAENVNKTGNFVFKKVISTETIIDIIKKNDFRDYDIYVSSEDQTIINVLKEEFPEHNFVSSRFLVDKNIVFSNQANIDIEGFCYNNTEYIENIVISAIIDLYFFQRSNIIIGPIFLSAFTYCGYILACGYNRRLIKFIDPTTDRQDVENISMI